VILLIDEGYSELHAVADFPFFEGPLCNFFSLLGGTVGFLSPHSTSPPSPPLNSVCQRAVPREPAPLWNGALLPLLVVVSRRPFIAARTRRSPYPLFLPIVARQWIGCSLKCAAVSLRTAQKSLSLYPSILPESSKVMKCIGTSLVSPFPNFPLARCSSLNEQQHTHAEDSGVLFAVPFFLFDAPKVVSIPSSVPAPFRPIVCVRMTQFPGQCLQPLFSSSPFFPLF